MRSALVLALVVVGAAVLVLGAVGLTGFLTSEDYCISDDLRYRMWPPGMTCTPAEDLGKLGVDEDTGSAPGFVLALVVGGVVAALALRLRTRSPTPLRLATVLIAMFAIAGIGALAGAGRGALFFGLTGGSVAAYVVDLAMRPPSRPWTAGLTGWLIALAALIVAGTLWLFGLELEAFAIPFATVIALATLVEQRTAANASVSHADDED